MNFDEFLKTGGVITSKSFPPEYEHLENLIGKQFWICDFRLNREKDAKPIRNVQPKKVQVFSNDDLSKGKNVYYSPIHFREIKNGKVTSGIIAPFDNTGYRTYPGISVNIFTTESECRVFFVKQCEQAIEEYEEELKRRTEEIQGKIGEIKEMKAEFMEK